MGSVQQLHWHFAVLVSSDVNLIACCMSYSAMQHFQRGISISCCNQPNVQISTAFGKGQLKCCVPCNGFKVFILRVQLTSTTCSAPTQHMLLDVRTRYQHTLNR